jgi:mono/diheme cytochrome c family protein
MTMRPPLIALLFLAGSAACNRAEESKAPVVAASPAQLSFDGADYKAEAAKVAHGERISWALGCHGCHTKSLQGQRFYELYASNLTREVPKYSDSQLDRLVRGGIHPSGRDVWAMPSEIFQHLSDTDFRAVLARLRTLKPGGEPTGKPLPFERETRKLIAKGEIMPAALFVTQLKSTTPLDLGEKYALGRYITMVTCAECHGPQLKGHPGDTPDLIIAGGYSREEFETLMTKGVPSGGRKLKNPLMGEVARERFVHFTPHERDALYAYLKARAELPQ